MGDSAMVQVSATAVAVLEESRREQDVPDSHGVRLFGQRNEEGRMMLRLTFTEDPHDRDQQMEQHGTEFYVASDVAESLQDVILDASADDGQLTLRRAGSEA
jgi:Fe-S cluster assembly iron-binding protein IscA